MAQGSVKDTTGYVNYVYNISARGITQLSTQLLGLSGVTGQILGQLAFQTTSYLSETEGALMTMGVAATVGFTKATQQAMEFDQALSTISAISGKSGSAIDNLGEQAMDMSEKFGMAVGEMTKGLETLARAGVSAGNMNAILEQAMGLSKLEGLSLEAAINDLISTTNLLDTQGLDLESPEYAEAVKQQNQRITATSEAAPINAQDIIHTLEHVGGYASSTNIDQEDLFAVIAQLGSKGTKSEIAGTSLRAFLAAGQKDTAQRALKRIGLDVSDLWKNDDTIMSISDMKDVLDEAMEAKGYTQQEKLEFYSDFAGYKQANQIMKIDTTSVREFKDKIDRSWDISKKMETVIGTAETNFKGMVQAGLNFLTKVGKPLLPVISTISWVTKNIIGLIDKIPGSHLLVTGGMILVAIKGISTIFNKIGPQLLESVNNVATMSDFFNDIRENLEDTFFLLRNIGNVNVLRDKQFENEINRIDDEDRIKYYQDQGYDVRTPEEIIKLKSKEDDQHIIDLKRERLMKALEKKEEDKDKEDKDHRVGQNRKTAPTKESKDEIIKPLTEIKSVLDNIYNVIDQFKTDNTGTTVLETTSNVDLSPIESKLDSLIQTTSVLYSISNSIDNFKNDNINKTVESKIKIDDSIINDLKNHTWNVRVIGPVATLTKSEREKKWKDEGWTMHDFYYKKPSHMKPHANTGQVFGGHSRYSYHDEQYEDYHMSSDAQRRKGRQKRADARRRRNQAKKRKEEWRNRHGPVYGETPTPDYEMDGSYGFEYEVTNVTPTKSRFDIGITPGEFRTARGNVNRARRAYNKGRKEEDKITSKNGEKWEKKIADIYLKDPNSPIIKEFEEIMRKDSGEKGSVYLSNFLKQMTPIRTRGSMQSDKNIAQIVIKETGSSALDTVGKRIEQEFNDTQQHMGFTGQSFRTDLDAQQIEKELYNVISVIFKKVGEARLNLQETNPQELQEYSLTPKTLDKVSTKPHAMIIADALGLLGEGNLTREKIFSNKFANVVKPEFLEKMKGKMGTGETPSIDPMLEGALILGSIQQSPLMQTLQTLQKEGNYDNEGAFMNDVVKAFNEVSKYSDNKNLKLSMRGLDLGANGVLKKGENKLENIVYTLAMESATNKDQDAIAKFILDFISNLKDRAGVYDDVAINTITEQALHYDEERRKEAEKEIEDIDLTENVREREIFTIDSHHKGYAGNFVDESGIDSGWGEDAEMYDYKYDDTHGFTGASGAILDKTTVATGQELSTIIAQHGAEIEDIAQLIHEAETKDYDVGLDELWQRLDLITGILSPEQKKSLLSSYGLRYNRRINKNAVDPTALTNDEYYNSIYGRNTAFFNGVELGILNDQRATFPIYMMQLFEELGPVIAKASALEGELQTAADIDFLKELGLLDKDFDNAIDFLRAINNLIADVHVKGKALQSRHRGYRGLGDQSTPQATVGVAIREQGNVAADKNVAKVLPDPDAPDKNYVLNKLQNRSLTSIAHLSAPLRTRAGLPETGGMKLGIKHVTTGMSKEEYENSIFSEIPWLMKRAKSPVEVMYALEAPNEYGDTGVWHKNAAGNFANIWTPEAMLKRLAATDMGNVIENLGALALYDKTSGEEGDEHIITSANVKDIASNRLSMNMLEAVEFMYGSQGFTSLDDLKLKAGDNYKDFTAEVRKRMDTAAPDEDFTPDGKANNQFKRWVNKDELERLKLAGLLDDEDLIDTRVNKREDGSKWTEYLVYDWEALRLSKEEVAQQYTVMMMANAMLAQEMMTKKLAMAPDVFDEFADEVAALPQTILTDPRSFLSMNQSELIAYGATNDDAFAQIHHALNTLTSDKISSSKITSLLQNVTVGDLGAEFVSKLDQMGYYTDMDDETFYATNVATIAESFGGTYELVVDILKDMFFQMEQIREMNQIFDPEGKIAKSVEASTVADLVDDAVIRGNTDTQTELMGIKRNITKNKKEASVTLLDDTSVVTGVPYTQQDNTPDMWKRSMSNVFSFSDVWEEIEGYLDVAADATFQEAQEYQKALSVEAVNFIRNSSIDVFLDDNDGTLTKNDIRREALSYFNIKGQQPNKNKKHKKDTFDKIDYHTPHYDSGYQEDAYDKGNYILPEDAFILDSNPIMPPSRNKKKYPKGKIQEDYNRENERKLTSKELAKIEMLESQGILNTISKNITREEEEKREEEERYDREQKQNIKILKDIYRNIDIKEMQELLETYKKTLPHFDYLYGIAVNEVDLERYHAQNTTHNIKTRNNMTKSMLEPKRQEQKKKETQEKNQEHVVNEIMGLRNAYQMLVNDVHEEVKEEIKEEIKDIKSVSVADMYGAQDYINTYGEKEGIQKSLIGMSGYKDVQKDFDSETQKLINERNKAAWKSVQKTASPTGEYGPFTLQYNKGKANTQMITDHIKSQVTQLSNFIGEKASTMMNEDKSKEASELLDNINSHLTDSTELLKGVNSVINDFASTFPPLTVAVLALTAVISTIEKAALINNKVNSFIHLGQNIQQNPDNVIKEVFGHEIKGNSGLGQMIMGISGGLAQLLKAIETFIRNNLGPLLLIVGAFTAIKTALDWSYKSHEKYLKQLQDEEKANKSKSRGLQTINEQNKKALMKNKNEEKEDELGRRYRLSKQKLDAANLTRTSGALNLTGAENDMLWGKYGIASALDKMQGKYESTAAEYDGTSGQIRRIKEHTTGGQGLIRGMPGYYSQAEEMVAAYYDANQLAIGVMDEYKDELGELYDAETNAMRKHPDENPRETREFQKALDKFVEATGITKEHAQQYLDYMQTEHNVDNATQAMQAQADLISANTEMKIQAIAFGGNPSDVLGLNGIEAQQNAMVQAQADMIQLELSSQLWWKAVWSTITSPIRAIIAPIFSIVHILSAIWSFVTGNWDAAGMHMKQAGASLNVLGETATYWGAWATAESTDFNSIGKSAIDENDRANYGNAKATASHGGPRVPIPEDNSFFGIFPVGWPDEYRFKGHGRKDHKDQLAQNAQQSFFSQLMAPIAAILGTISGSILTIITILGVKLLNDKFDLISKLPNFMQGPLGFMSGVGHSLYDNLVPEKIKDVIGITQGFMGQMGSRIYHGIESRIPDSWKEKLNTAKEWVKGKVGLGEDEGITEENDPVGAATIKSKDILEAIFHWLTGNQFNKDAEIKESNPRKNLVDYIYALQDQKEEKESKPRKRINIEDGDEKRRSPLDLLRLQYKNNLIDTSTYHKELQNFGINPMQDVLDNISTIEWTDTAAEAVGRMGPNGQLMLNAFDLAGDAPGAISTYIHELSHGALNHWIRRQQGQITATSDNYEWSASELEARMVTEKVLKSMNLVNNDMLSGALERDKQKAKEEGTWDEVREDLVDDLANQMINNPGLLLGGLINIIRGSEREKLLGLDTGVKKVAKKNKIKTNIYETKNLQDIVSDKELSDEEKAARLKTYYDYDDETIQDFLQGDEQRRPQNLSQAVRMQTMMPSTVGMSGEEIAQMEKDEDIHKKALLRKHITENEKHFENVPKSQAVLAQILPFLGIEPEFDSEEYKRRNRGQKYGNRITEGMSGEEIAEREKEQSKYYKKPQTYEETLHPPRDIQNEINQEFDAIDSSNWAENHKKISKANKPQNDLVAKGRALKEMKAQYDAAGMLGQMMENPQATAYDTLNKMEGVQICDQCGHKNPLGAKVCEQCGARLDGKGKIGGALSNFFEKAKHTVTGGEAEEGMSFTHRMQQISGMGKRHQRKNKSKEDAMEMGKMGFFADMMGNASEAAEKTRTRALKICPECGHQNPQDATHCEQCGARLDGRGKVGGFFADKMAIAKGKIKSKTTDKVKNKIDDTTASVKSQINGTMVGAEATGAGLLGGLYENIGNNRIYNKITNMSGLTLPGFNPNEESWKGNRVRVPIEDGNIPKVKVPKIINPKTGKPYDLSHHDVEKAAPTFINRSAEVAERMANGESFKDIAMDHLTSEGEGPGGLFGEKGGLKKVGGIGGKVGNFLQAQGGKAGKVGNIVSKGSNMLSSAGGKGAGGLLKSGLGKVAGSKIGGRVMSKVGSKLASKGISQVASKVLAGGLAATGIGAPLAAIMASPIGGFLVEGAMNLGGKALGAVGGAIGGIGKALGFGRRPVGGRGGKGILGGLMAATPLGMMAGAAGNLIGSVFGGGSRNMGAIGGKALGMVAAPLGGVVGMLGKMFSNDKQTKSLNEKMEAHAGKTLEAVREQNSKSTPATSNSGGNITIQNININTADDPEAIKAMFLELIIELQEQVNPRLVSRTAGKPPESSSTSTSPTEESEESSENVQQGASDAANALSNGNSQQTNN